MKLKFILLLLIFISTSVFAEEQDTLTPFAKVLEKFYKSSNHFINQPIVEFKYGISSISANNDNVRDIFAKTYNSELIYGFARLYDDIKARNRIYYANEFIFASNISSHFKPGSWGNVGITTDDWRFGVGYRNGFGYTGNKSGVILYHSGSLNYSRTDFEMSLPDTISQKFLKPFDKQFRFGTAYEGGVILHLNSSVYANGGYEHLIIFPEFNTGKWLTSASLELIAQRTLDYFAYDLVEEYPDTYPFINFAIKNSLSILLYELRRQNVYWPLESPIPLNYDIFKVGITLIF